MPLDVAPEDIGQINEQCLLFEMAKKLYDAGQNMTGQKVTVDGTTLTALTPVSTRRRYKTPLERKGVYTISDGEYNADLGADNDVNSPYGGIEDNYEFIKLITLKDNPVQGFLEMTPAETAQMAPRMLISVDHYDERGKKRNSTPLDFPNKTKPGIFTSKSQRTGAGIKEIKVTHEGIDSATDKIVLVDSVFLLQDFRSITTSGQMVPIGNTNTKVTVGYADLITLGLHAPNGLRRWIKFTFGWNSHADIERKLHLTQMQTEIRAELVKYTFDLNEDGSILLKTQHRGFMNTVTGNNNWANIMASITPTQAEISAGQQRVKDLASTIRTTNLRAQRENALKLLANAAFFRMMRRIKPAATKSPATRTAADIELFEQTQGFDVVTSGEYGYDPHPAKGIYGWAEQANASNEFKNLGIGGTPMALGTRWLKGDWKSEWTTGALNDPAVGGAGFSTTLDASQRTIVDAQFKHLFESLRDSQSASPGFAAGTRQDVDGQHWLTLAEVKFALDALHAAQERHFAGRDRGTIARNLRPNTVLNTARAISAQENALRRYLLLGEWVKKLQDNNNLHYGAITEENFAGIITNLGITEGLKAAFGKISANKFMTNVKFLDVARNPSGAPTNATQLSNAQEQLNESRTMVVPFIFLGDFLGSIVGMPANRGAAATDTLFASMLRNTGVQMATVLGRGTFTTPYTQEKIENFPLYYLPLSLKAINGFITREIVAKDRIFYSYGDFVKDVFKKFLDVQFYNCRQDAKTGQTLTAPKFQFAFGKGTAKANSRQIMFIYDGKADSEDILTGGNFGSYNFNMKKKIPHFYLGGPDKGISTKIQLRDIADPTLKTAVYFGDRPSKGVPIKEGDPGPDVGRWAPQVYEATIDTVGYPLFGLGHLVYVDVKFVTGATAVKNFQATGYYGVHKISHTISAEGFFTTIVGIIQHSEASFNDQEKSRSTGDPRAAKLYTNPSSASPAATTPATTTTTTRAREETEAKAEIAQLKNVIEKTNAATAKMSGQQTLAAAKRFILRDLLLESIPYVPLVGQQMSFAQTFGGKNKYMTDLKRAEAQFRKRLKALVDMNHSVSPTVIASTNVLFRSEPDQNTKAYIFKMLKGIYVFMGLFQKEWNNRAAWQKQGASGCIVCPPAPSGNKTITPDPGWGSSTTTQTYAYVGGWYASPLTEEGALWLKAHSTPGAPLPTTRAGVSSIALPSGTTLWLPMNRNGRWLDSVLAHKAFETDTFNYGGSYYYTFTRALWEMCLAAQDVAKFTSLGGAGLDPSEYKQLLLAALNELNTKGAPGTMPTPW